MRKLLIDARIRSFASQYSTELQAQQNHVVEDLEELRDNVIAYNTWADATAPRDYIDEIIKDYPSLLTLEPKDWDINKYDNILARDPGMLTREVIYDYTKPRKYKGVLRPAKAKSDKLYERIMFCLRYSDARIILGEIHQQMGLRACFYCNIQALDSSDGQVFYEMDHLKAQSQYPFLGTCFYNLQPCDSACNKRKLTKPCDFQMYINDATEERSPFKFVPQVVQLGSTWSYDCLKIDFLDRNGAFSQECKDYDETFQIIKHYAAHRKDVAEIYSDNQKFASAGSVASYIAAIGAAPSKDDLCQLFLKSPYDEDRIHEAPLNKLKIDTIKQLEEKGVLIVYP